MKPWAAMAKHKTSILYFHPAAISLPSPPIFRTSYHFCRDSIYELNVPKSHDRSKRARR